MTNAAVARAHAQILKWKADPVLFVADNFKATPDPWQHDFLQAIGKEHQIALKACKGPGKTCGLAWGIWWFASTRVHPKMAATSISRDNLSDCLWTELAKWQNASEFLSAAFRWTRTRIEAKDHPETWWMSARAWSRSADSNQQADTLAGLHGDSLLFVLDEVGSIPDSVMAAAEAGRSTGGDTHIWMAGNPTEVSGPLYRACTDEADKWFTIEITGDPDDPRRSPRISKEWARDQIKKYGRDNPWVLVNVFGRFPPAALNALLGPEDVTAAIDRHLTKDQYEWAAKILGIDVARFGDDRTVLVMRHGLASFEPKIMRNARTEEIAGVAAQMIHKHEIDAVMVDGTGGYGAGVIDALRVLGVEVHEVQASGKATDERYYNKRAECHFKLADWVKSGGAIGSGSRPRTRSRSGSASRRTWPTPCR
jgi:hypothetical protein